MCTLPFSLLFDPCGIHALGHVNMGSFFPSFLFERLTVGGAGQYTVRLSDYQHPSLRAGSYE